MGWLQAIYMFSPKFIVVRKAVRQQIVQLMHSSRKQGPGRGPALLHSSKTGPSSESKAVQDHWAACCLLGTA